MGFYYRYKFDHGAPQAGIEAIKWYRHAAEQGNADAQTNLGFCYEFGHGVPQDIAEAAKWYRMAAVQGCADAQNKLVVGIQSGRIVPLDNEEEWKWYLSEEKARVVRSSKKGAERGEMMDQFVLGLHYEKGFGGPQDLSEAYKWLKLAAAQNPNLMQKYLDRLTPGMTSDQLQEGERRYSKFKLQK